MSDYTKPYLYSEWKKAVERMAQQEVYETAAEPESQFKKPYLQDISYPVMEYEWDYRNGPYNPGITQPFETDCTPQGYAVGGGSPETFCDEVGVFCGVWEFTCAHKITKFGVIQNNGWIQSVQYFANDVVRVTVCFDESNKGQISGPQAYMANGQSVVAKVSVGTVCEPQISGDNKMCASASQYLVVISGVPPYQWSASCGTLDPTVGERVSYTAPATSGTCTVTVTDSGGRRAKLDIEISPTVSMKYTTQQMSAGQQQTLYAQSGVPPFSWSIVSGGGSVNPSTGFYTVYTAPTGTNTNCANNPTIRLTDACGNYVELKIAINTGIYYWRAAYRVVCDTEKVCSTSNNWCTWSCPLVALRHIECGGYEAQDSSCCCPGGPVGGICPNPCETNNCCSQGYPEPTTCGCADCAESAEVCYSLPLGITDTRTPEDLAAGCCPWQLL